MVELNLLRQLLKWHVIMVTKKKESKTGDQEIIVFDNNFHGRMITTVSLSTTEKYYKGFGPRTPGFKICHLW